MGLVAHHDVLGWSMGIRAGFDTARALAAVQRHFRPDAVRRCSEGLPGVAGPMRPLHIWATTRPRDTDRRIS